MVRLISRQRGGLAALKLTKLFRIDDFPAAKGFWEGSYYNYILLFNYYYYLATIVSRALQPRNNRIPCPVDRNREMF